VAGGTSTDSVDLAARLGLPLMLPTVFASPKKFVPMADRYRERFQEAGHDPARMLVGGANYVYTERRSQDAVAAWRPYLESYYLFNQDRIIAGGSALAMVKERIPFNYEALLAGPGICGSPAQVSDRIAEIQRMLDLDVHLLLMDLGGLPTAVLLDELDLIGSDVLPHLGSTTRTPVTRA
jgi:alkanesulfonate monooxygenase SsuD/methylene tetrahydromethanopterin reductase-like flavin-dependent oxidoreductase (luciferase family)